MVLRISNFWRKVLLARFLHTAAAWIDAYVRACTSVYDERITQARNSITGWWLGKPGKPNPTPVLEANRKETRHLKRINVPVTRVWTPVFPLPFTFKLLVESTLFSSTHFSSFIQEEVKIPLKKYFSRTSSERPTDSCPIFTVSSPVLVSLLLMLQPTFSRYSDKRAVRLFKVSFYYLSCFGSFTNIRSEWVLGLNYSQIFHFTVFIITTQSKDFLFPRKREYLNFCSLLSKQVLTLARANLSLIYTKLQKSSDICFLSFALKYFYIEVFLSFFLRRNCKKSKF